MARTTLAIATRITILHHEVRDDAVNFEAIEEPLARQLHEIARRLRRVEHGELELNRAVGGLDEHVRRVLGPMS